MRTLRHDVLGRFIKAKHSKAATESPVRFVKSKRSVASQCPACGLSSKKILLVVEDQDRKLEVVKCRCGTIFYPGAVAPDYEVVENRASFFMRIDQAEGIDSSLMPLFSSPSLNRMPVLDIGCGLGFTSDFIRFQGRGCLAFDPSSAAKLSTEFLKIEILSEYASMQNTLMGEPALAFASEVIEHVDNPLSFLRDIHEILGNQGFVIATTPNASFVKKENPTNTLLAMLAPSQHLFLLSEKSLLNLAKNAGFTWAKTWVVEERLFLIAGPEEVSLQNCFPRDQYILYLERQIQNLEIDGVIRHRAFGYRLFKEYVHSSRYELANNLYGELSKSYLTLGFDLSNPLEIVNKYTAAAGLDKTLPDPEFFPYNMALVLYLQGTLLLAYRHDRLAARPYFDAAILLSDLYRQVFTQGIFQAYDLEIQSVSQWAEESIQIHCL